MHELRFGDKSLTERVESGLIDESSMQKARLRERCIS